MLFSGIYTFQRIDAFDGLGNLSRYNSSGTVIGGIPEIPTHLVKNAQQFYTMSGPYLRRLSIDELPQLININ